MKETILNDIDVSLGDLQVLTENSARAGDHIYKGQPTHEKLLKIGLKAMLDAFPPFELQNAVAANNALLQLLAEHIELAHMEDGPGSLRGIGSGPFLIGISQLLAMCRQRLNRATEVES